MSDIRNVLVIGARAEGYGGAIARAASEAGLRVFGTTLNPNDPREKAFFDDIGAQLIPVPLKFSVEGRAEVLTAFSRICDYLVSQGVHRLDAAIHTVAGGFPRQPAVMKAIGDIMKGNLEFKDLATAVKRNVYYVNAGSFDDMIRGLDALSDEATVFGALTYRGDLPYFISPSKAHLEKLAARNAAHGKSTLIAALPEAWTQSSQFFTGIELGVLYNYLTELQGPRDVGEPLRDLYAQLETAIAGLPKREELLAEITPFFDAKWSAITESGDWKTLSTTVQELFTTLRSKGVFSSLRRAVGDISHYVRIASAKIFVERFLLDRRFVPGEIRQMRYRDLTGMTEIPVAAPSYSTIRTMGKARRWVRHGKDVIDKTLSMYGANFRFLDEVVMEEGEIQDGFIGFARYTVPTPEENPILKDHFVGMPLFGGHLQMEAVAQFGTFMILTALKDKRLFPILTGTEFPDLNTMAPPGETLTMMGVIRLQEKRKLTLEAFIENRFARSKGKITGIILNERLLRKMRAAFLAEGDIESGDADTE